MDFSDPLPGNNADNNEILAISEENSIGSHDMLSTTDDINVKQEENSVSYQFVQMNNEPNKVQLQTIGAPIQQQQQYFVIGNVSDYIIGNLSTTTPLKIAPKTSGSATRNPLHIGGTSTLSGIASPTIKKRDDRRRATHNEVERKRRNKINQWIEKLGDIIQANTKIWQTDGSGSSADCSTPNECQSKGGILSKACEYIPTLQENIRNLTECLNESKQIGIENQKLQKRNKELEQENNELKLILKSHGISVISSSPPSSPLPFESTITEDTEECEILS